MKKDMLFFWVITLYMMGIVLWLLLLQLLFDRFWPLARLIWYSSHFIPPQAYVGPDGNSDRLPVLAKLSLIEN